MSERHGQVLEELLAALRRLPQIAALAAYGSTADRSWSEGSDIDLFGDRPCVHTFPFVAHH